MFILFNVYIIYFMSMENTFCVCRFYYKIFYSVLFYSIMPVRYCGSYTLAEVDSVSVQAYARPYLTIIDTIVGQIVFGGCRIATRCNIPPFELLPT